MKTLFVLAALIGSSASYAMSTVDVDFAYTLPGYAAGTASALITELNQVIAASNNLNTASADLYGGCLVSVRGISAIQADARVFASLHCNGVDSLNQQSVAALISGPLATKVGVPMMPVFAKPNPGVVMSNARTVDAAMSTIDLDFDYVSPGSASGSAADLIAVLNKVGNAGVALKAPNLYAGGCLIYTSEIDAAQADAHVFATIHCDGDQSLTQESVANLVDGQLSKATGLTLKPQQLDYNNN